MKRLVWLLLLAFGTALAQVPPVDVRLIPADACDCCETANTCGMADCIPSPASAQPVLSLQTPGSAVAPRTAAAPQVAREKFYAQFLPRVRVAPALPVTATAVLPAEAPLFRAHCSFLI